MRTGSLRLKLKIVWFRSFLGLAIDQIGLNQQFSLTPYYFWPKTEAWEQLKIELDSKLWLSQKEKTEILKIAGDVMNFWLLHRDTKTLGDLKKDLSEDVIIIFQ